MYFIESTVFLILLLHQCIGFNFFDLDVGSNYLNKEVNSITSPFTPEVVTRWIIQELDHFNPKDNRSWKMKYFEGLTHWKENGPIYMVLGDRRPALRQWHRSGIINELAKETHGAMFLTEHRYYGDSKPFVDLDADNMKYLSSRQALADVAKLISYLKSLPIYKDSKVVVIGCFYAGNLAAWMKVLYPKLIDAVISSSAPVLAQKDFYEYLEKVKDNIEHYGGTECLDKITKKFEYDYSLLQSPEGIKQLIKDESICDTSDMTIVENQQLYFFSKTRFISVIGGGPILIQKYCESLKDKNDYNSFVKKYSKVNNSEDKPCYPYNFHELIELIKNTNNTNQLLFQSCTEFGQFPTTSSKNQPFLNIPLEFYIKICSGLFGNDFNEKRVDEGIEISNKLYGGLKPNVTNVVFINGDMDPWSTISVLKNLSLDAPAVVIPRASQCRDLSSDRDSDSKELKEARKYVKNLIKKWIGEGTAKKLGQPGRHTEGSRLVAKIPKSCIMKLLSAFDKKD